MHMNETIKVLRGEQEWQRAGAYSVRVQGMNRQHHISLREEFDDHDGDGTRYIILLDDEYPMGTCRFYPLDEETVTIGRVVVLEEYRGRELGRLLLQEAEKWIRELGYRYIRIDSRTVAVGFYEKCGYHAADGTVYRSGPFDCTLMVRDLAKDC